MRGDSVKVHKTKSPNEMMKAEYTQVGTTLYTTFGAKRMRAPPRNIYSHFHPEKVAQLVEPGEVVGYTKS